MKHRSHKLKFGSGIDANRMVLRKLAYNFIKSGKIVTTEKRAKALKSYIETLVQKTRKDTTANRNFLLKKLGSQTMLNTMFNQVGPALKEKTSGYTTTRRLHARVSDGSAITEIQWSLPVVMEQPKKEIETVEKQPKKVAVKK